jgi:4'-phosphopantetheinyl transferase
MGFKITHDFEWITASAKPPLATNAIHVWRIILPIHQDIKKMLEQNLSSDEQHRASKFYFAADTERFIIARGALRDIIARYINIPAQDIIFAYTKCGKPYLPHSNFHFNLSHSGQYILYAFTKCAEIGVDIEECKNNIEFVSVAKEFLSEAEHRQFLMISPEERCLAFYRAWTRKEAVLKAMGEGLYFPANQLEVDFSSSAKIKLTKILGQVFFPKSWQLFQMAFDKNYVSAIAIKKLSVKKTKMNGPYVKFDYPSYTI